MYVCTHMCVRLYVYMRKCVRLSICVCVYVCMCINVYMCKCVSVRGRRGYMCMSVCKYVYVSGCM